MVRVDVTCPRGSVREYSGVEAHSGEVDDVAHRVALSLGYRVHREIVGGFGGGRVYELRCDGERAVLKFIAPAFEPKALALLPLIGQLRRRGWPAAAWLDAGALEGRTWTLQEFVAGPRLDGPTADTTPPIIGAIHTQAGLGSAVARVVPDADHGAAIQRFVQDGGGPVAGRVADWSTAGRALVKLLSKSFGDIGEVPTADLVHGDVGPGNVVFPSPDRPVFLDVENLGFGSRAHDLAALYVRAVQSGDRVSKALLCDSGVGVSGARVFDASVAMTMLGNITWLIDNAPDRVEPRIAVYREDRSRSQ